MSRIIPQAILHKLRSHACFWQGLPEVTVPSAEVSDEQTSTWSDELYARDLAEDRKHNTRRALTLIGLGGMLVAGVLFGAGAARADGILSDTEAAYVLAYGAGAVCPTISEYPSTAGVMGVAQGIMSDGFTADSAVDIINSSVANYCPQFWTLLERIGAEARGEGPLRRAS